jgi:hypothetical protein
VAVQLDPNAGQEHHDRNPHRLRRTALLGGQSGRGLLVARLGIGRALGNALAFAGGRGPPPAWVRRRHRMPRRVWAKLAVSAARILRNHDPAA